jgi:hypothetical protein
MSIYEDGPFRTAINDKLASIAATSSSEPPWYEAWRRLSPQSSEAERLAVYQSIHRDGCLPLEAGFYLVAWQANAVALERAEIELSELDDQMVAVKEAHGLDDDDFWTLEDAPPEFRELRQRHQAAWDQILVETLVACGEGDMAELFQHDREEFERRLEVGRQFFRGEATVDDLEAGDWLEELIAQIADLMTFHSPAGPLGYRYGEEDGFWEIVVYPTPVEIVGGADDGEVVLPGFQLDLLVLQELFDEIEEFGWDGLGLCSHGGPHVWAEGLYQGRHVFLTVLAEAPEDEEPGFKLNVRRSPRD